MTSQRRKTNETPWRLVRKLVDDAGTVAIEFAMTAPVLFLFLFGTIEAGRLLWTQADMQFACEEAVRWGAVHRSAGTSEITDKAKAALTAASQADVSFSVSATSVEVTVTAVHSFTSVVSDLVPLKAVRVTAGSRLAR